jgi:hypothetical protein
MLLDYKIFLILGIPDQSPLIALITNVWAAPEYDSIHGTGRSFPSQSNLFHRGLFDYGPNIQTEALPGGERSRRGSPRVIQWDLR